MTEPSKDRYLMAVGAWLARTCPYAEDRVVVIQKKAQKPPPDTAFGIRSGPKENPNCLTARIRRIVGDAGPDGISSAGIESVLRRMYPDETVGTEKISALAGQETKRGRLRSERIKKKTVWFIAEYGT